MCLRPFGLWSSTSIALRAMLHICWNVIGNLTKKAGRYEKRKMEKIMG
jgi:hypothetical protein